MHAILTEMIGADVGDDGGVGMMDRQAAAQDAAPRGFQHRRLHPCVAQYLARAGGPGIITALDLLAGDEYAVRAVESGLKSRGVEHGRQQPHRGGLAIGAGDQHGWNIVQAGPVDVGQARGQGVERPGATALARPDRHGVVIVEGRQSVLGGDGEQGHDVAVALPRRRTCAGCAGPSRNPRWPDARAPAAMAGPASCRPRPARPTR